MNTLKRESRSTNPLKIIQFGGGNFLRAFVDWMIDELNEKTDFNGGILLIKPTEKGDYDSLLNQDGLFHVVTQGIKNGQKVEEVQLISCVQEIIHPYTDFDDYLSSAHIESIRFMVSNTTESGICFNKDDKFTNTPAHGFPGKLTQWLFERYKHFRGDKDKGIIIIPCELIENNGVKLNHAIRAYADVWKLETGFSQWLEEACVFCNTLVDRIVTGYPYKSASHFFNKIGYEDKALTSAEPYHLFVIEGPDFVADELPFDKTDLNIIFSDKLTKYRDIKVRILNGAHTALVPVAYLQGFRTVGEAIQDSETIKYIHQILKENILPTLDYAEEELRQYVSDVIDRFKNPFIEHKLIDISLNSIAKFKTRLLPSLLAYVEKRNELPSHIVKALAALLVFYKGNYNGEAIELRDSKEIITYFEEEWSSVKTTEDIDRFIEKVLGNKVLWSINLNTIKGLHKTVSNEINRLLKE